MTRHRTILILDDDQDRQYQQAQQALDEKYHNPPTKLRQMPHDDNWWPFRTPARPPDYQGKVGKLVI